MKKYLLVLLLICLANKAQGNQVNIEKIASIANDISALIVASTDKDLPKTIQEEVHNLVNMLKDSGTESINQSSLQDLITPIYTQATHEKTVIQFFKQALQNNEQAQTADTVSKLSPSITHPIPPHKKPTVQSTNTVQSANNDTKPNPSDVKKTQNILQRFEHLCAYKRAEEIRQECFVCEFDDMYSEQTPLIILSCNHALGHSDCIAGWFNILVQNNREVRCPACDQRISPEEWGYLYNLLKKNS